MHNGMCLFPKENQWMHACKAHCVFNTNMHDIMHVFARKQIESYPMDPMSQSWRILKPWGGGLVF